MICLDKEGKLVWNRQLTEEFGGKVPSAPLQGYITEVGSKLKDQTEVVCDAPFRIIGFEEAMRCVSAGRLESPRMPHAETLALARWNHEVLRQLGVRYPFE